VLLPPYSPTLLTNDADDIIGFNEPCGASTPPGSSTCPDHHHGPRPVLDPDNPNPPCPVHGHVPYGLDIRCPAHANLPPHGPDGWTGLSAEQRAFRAEANDDLPPPVIGFPDGTAIYRHPTGAHYVRATPEEHRRCVEQWRQWLLAREREQNAALRQLAAEAERKREPRHGGVRPPADCPAHRTALHACVDDDRTKPWAHPGLARFARATLPEQHTIQRARDDAEGRRRTAATGSATSCCTTTACPPPPLPRGVEVGEVGEGGEGPAGRWSAGETRRRAGRGPRAGKGGRKAGSVAGEAPAAEADIVAGRCPMGHGKGGK